jgi:hypothetical protein
MGRNHACAEAGQSGLKSAQGDTEARIVRLPGDIYIPVRRESYQKQVRLRDLLFEKYKRVALRNKFKTTQEERTGKQANCQKHASTMVNHSARATASL